MNSIERLHDYIIQAHPTATAELTPPLHDWGIWSLDVDKADKRLAIHWSPTTGFGVSNANNENFGEGPDEIFDQLEPVQRRVDELLTTTERTSPEASILLSRLRESRGITQQELADRIGVRQATVSGIERRDDVQLSTLRRVVEALEGVLEIFAAFPDARYRIHTPRPEYLSSPPNVINLKRVPISRGELFEASTFTLLSETGGLKRASDTASIIRKKRAVIEMV
jgi:transcriptional regulator with XRE-family HTH domain